MKVHVFTCIKCPLSCEIELTEENQIVEVKGHMCKQGETYAINEFTNPVRILTTTVCVEDGVLPVLPVRSVNPIPKQLIKESVRKLSTVKMKAPIACGDLICENILNTGISIVASRDMPRRK